MLSELGFLANQHELLSDNFCKDQYKGVHESVKRLKDTRKKNIKEAEKIAGDLKSAYKSMESSREKFRKAYDEQERTTQAFNRWVCMSVWRDKSLSSSFYG